MGSGGQQGWEPAEGGAGQAVELRILGPLELVAGGAAITLGGPKQRAVLATFALRPNELVSTDALVDVLWGDHAPRSAVGVIRTYASRLRRILSAHDGARLMSQPPGYVLELDAPDQVDAHRFEQLVARARSALASGDPDSASATLHRALGLWRGDVLADLPDIGAFRHEAIRLSELRLSAIEARIDAELALGHHGDLVGELEALTDRQPLHERFWGQLMVALYRTGRQADALVAYQTARSTLADKAGLDPGPELRALERQVLDQAEDIRWPPSTSPGGSARGTAAQAMPATGRAPIPPGGLPLQLTRFFGREAEIAELLGIVDQDRLVTLVGAPGCGKTRLAIEVGARLASVLPGGVAFVDLATVTDAVQVAMAVSLALGIREQPGRAAEETLTDALAGAEPLLALLDNCEHVADAVADLALRLLASCPSLRVMATSRSRLGLNGERIWNLPPLGLAPATELFLDRARSASRDLRLGRAEVTAVEEICERLDRLPLSIELAAARTRVLSLNQIAARLAEALPLLTNEARGPSGRHRAMTAAIDWSYQLLLPEQQRLFEQFSVFVGGFDLTAAAAVSGSNGGDVLGGVAALVDHSLVATEAGFGGDMRYRMLEPVRQYAESLLVASGQSDAVRRRHAEHYLDLALRFDPWGVQGSWPVLPLPGLAQEEGNLAAALTWARDQSPEMALRLSDAMGPFWEFDGRVNEGRLSLDEVLAIDSPDPDLRPPALVTAGRLAWRQGDYEQARQLLDEALARARQRGNDKQGNRALRTLALVAISDGDLDTAVRLCHESIALSESMGGETPMAFALVTLGWAHYLQEDVPQGDEQLQTVLQAKRGSRPNPTAIVHALMGLQFGAFLAGDPARQRAHLTGALAAMDEGGMFERFDWLGSCISLAVGEGRYQSALRIAGGTQALRQRRYSEHPEGVILPLRVLSEQVDEKIDPALAEELRAEGARMSWDELVAEALAEPDDDDPP